MRDRWLLYAPLDGVRALVNRAALRELAGNQVPRGGELGELHQLLHGSGKAGPRPPAGPPRPPFLGLVPTRDCNLACSYCGFAGGLGSRERMSYARAVAAVDWMAERLVEQGRRVLEVHFFGGEPLVAADVVEVAVHRARAVAAREGLVPRFEIATNGVCNEPLARFMGDTIDTVVLSLDGPQPIHDRQRRAARGGSFDRTRQTAEILAASPADLCLRICVTAENVPQLAGIAEWFCETFLPAAIDFEPLKPGERSASFGLAPPDPFELARRYREAAAVATGHGVRAVYAAADTSGSRTSFCPVGKDAVIVSPDGRVSACYLLREEWRRKGLDLDLGHLGEGGEMLLDQSQVERVRGLTARKPRCERCFCRLTCAGGCHVHETFPECADGYGDFCVSTRLITACDLLGELGEARLAGELCADPAAMAALALQPSDRFTGVDEARG